ncbi:MAG: hypothetical protein AAFZ07_25640 [Actinomycetota bacterium]
MSGRILLLAGITALAVVAGVLVYGMIAPWFWLVRLVAWLLLILLGVGVAVGIGAVAHLELDDRDRAAYRGGRLTVLAPGEWRSPRDGEAAGAVLIGAITFAPIALLLTVTVPSPIGLLTGLALIRVWSAWYRYGRRRDMEAAGVTEVEQPTRRAANRPQRQRRTTRDKSSRPPRTERTADDQLSRVSSGESSPSSLLREGHGGS